MHFYKNYFSLTTRKPVVSRCMLLLITFKQVIHTNGFLDTSAFVYIKLNQILLVLNTLLWNGLCHCL